MEVSEALLEASRTSARHRGTASRDVAILSYRLAAPSLAELQAGLTRLESTH